MREEVARLAYELAGVSGAIIDAGSVVLYEGDYARSVRELTAERDEARRQRMPSTDEDAFMTAVNAFNDVDRAWMTREDLIGHYVGAIANWNIVLDERDALLARLALADAVVEAARMYRTRSEIDDTGLHAALQVYDSAKAGLTSAGPNEGLEAETKLAGDDAAKRVRE